MQIEFITDFWKFLFPNAVEWTHVDASIWCHVFVSLWRLLALSLLRLCRSWGKSSQKFWSKKSNFLTVGKSNTWSRVDRHGVNAEQSHVNCQRKNLPEVFVFVDYRNTFPVNLLRVFHIYLNYDTIGYQYCLGHTIRLVVIKHSYMWYFCFFQNEFGILCTGFSFGNVVKLQLTRPTMIVEWLPMMVVSLVIRDPCNIIKERFLEINYCFLMKPFYMVHTYDYII